MVILLLCYLFWAPAVRLPCQARMVGLTLDKDIYLIIDRCGRNFTQGGLILMILNAPDRRWVIFRCQPLTGHLFFLRILH